MPNVTTTATLYRQFKASQAQTKSVHRRARAVPDDSDALNSAHELPTPPSHWRRSREPNWKTSPRRARDENQATAYDRGKRGAAPSKQMMAELEALRARNAILEEDLTLKKAVDESEGEFAGMSIDQLREFIKTNTGQGPVGQPARKTLVRMAMDCRPEKVA